MRKALLALLVALAAPLAAAAPPPRMPAASPLRPSAAAPGWLGVAMADANGAIKVDHVVRGSPAEKAGLKDGDRITRVDATGVADPGEVTRLVSRHAPGDSVSVTVLRDGKELTVHAQVVARPSPEEMARMEHVGAFAPAWSKLTPVFGTPPASVGALRGRVALVEFWATWCGPCRLTAPALGTLQAKYASQGLSVVGITTDDATLAAEHARKTSMGFASAADTDSATSKAYGVTSLPTLFVIDKHGIVRDVTVGWEPGQEARVEKVVQGLLAEPAPSAP